MKISLVGGAGFIGANLLSRLTTTSGIENILVLDNLSSGTLSRIENFLELENVEFLLNDLKDVQQIASALEGTDFVIHLAANPDISKASQEPTIDFWQGTFLTQNLLEGMRLAGVERIVYVSGSGVYGEKPGTSFDEEFGPNLPISTYGASKLACEGLLSAYGHMFGIRSRILRLANVVGPKQTHGVTYDFIRKLRENHESLNVLGDGRQIKSYLEVSDVIDALLLMMGTLNEGECCEIFNVSSDTRLTVQEIADMAVSAFVLREKLSKRPEINFQDNSRGWKADVPDVELDSSKIRSIGWTGKYSSKESVSKALHHVLDETSQ